MLTLERLPHGEYGIGLRYRRTSLYPSLHPGIPPQMPLLRNFWQVARELVPAARPETQQFDELDVLEALGRDAGLEEVEAAPIDVSTRYESFAELWGSFELGVGPAGEYYGSLPAETQDALRDGYYGRIGEPEGAFDLVAQAWALRGRVPT